MENLNAEQIKKVLNHCANWTADTGCKGCPYDGDCIDKDVMKDALALITSQEQRIKELTQANEQLSESYDHLGKTKDELLSERARLAEENERLRGILLQFTDIVHKWGNKNGYDTSEIALVPILNEATVIKSQIEADTVRKMQERLKMYFGTYILDYKIPLNEVLKVINQIAKEMLEGI